MKKICIAFSLIGAVLFTPVVVNAENFDFATSWRQWLKVRQNVFHVPTTVTTSSLQNIPSSYVTKTRTTSKRTSRSRYNILRRRTPAISLSTVQARVTPIRPRQAVHTITSAPLHIFKVGIKNATSKNSQTFVEPLKLSNATFQLFSNSGIAEDVDNLELQIAGKTASFDDDGRVTVQFDHARIARGDSLDFDVFIKIKDPSTVPHIPGTLRLRLDRMTAVGETSQKVVNVQILGTGTSSKIVFDPAPTITGGSSQASGNTYMHISGRTLAAGEEVFVLGTNLSAYYDDLSLREVTLRNVLTGSDIDSFIDEIQAINLQTGKVIGTGRFSGGEAKFNLFPRPFIGRNQQMRLGFKIIVEDPIPHSSLDGRFKLDIAPEDLFIESVTTGRPLLDSNKHFSIDSREFAIAQGKLNIVSSGQQKSFAVNTTRPETVFRFIVNGGAQSVSLGRISLDAYLGGLEFSGGTLDASDVQLVRINGSRQDDEPVNITASGNNITLDFPTEFYIYKDDSVEFGLQLQLDNLPGNNDSDLVSMRLLGDSTHSKGTLASVRSAGSNFIWSDTSARMHSITTSDWISGYLVSGLPSNTTVVKRFGN